MGKTAIQPTRSENYTEWYQQVIKAADLAENSPVRGCMVIKPWGYAIWEIIQNELDHRLKETGHVNAYFPLLIPLSFLEKEAQHVEGFSKECAVVTHHRLVDDGKGGLKPDGELEDPFIIRPTSETVIGDAFSKWVRSYRDLPLLINQWANVIRWEMRTRLFLRSSEFLWQEGHTAHATKEEAVEETLKILDLYEIFSQDILAMPVIKGEKTISERFPGAVSTYCIEAMMQDGKALQAGTSHFLGQNFAKACDIDFLDRNGERQLVWTTSWAVTTRLIGGVIMSHGDDDGLVLPPTLAPHQIVILPICKDDQDRNMVLTACNNMMTAIKEKIFCGKSIRVHIDNREMRGGEKKWQWIKKGVPIILEIGKRDLDKNSVAILRRNCLDEKKDVVSIPDFLQTADQILGNIQHDILQSAKDRHDSNVISVASVDEFKQIFSDKEQDLNNDKFVDCFAADSAAVEAIIKPLKVTARCIPLDQQEVRGRCIFTNEEVSKKIVFAKAY